MTEDVPYGLVSEGLLATMLRIETAIIDSVIDLASVLKQTDYWEESRTVVKIVMVGFIAEQLNKYACEGEI